jgi:hypothetical protein
MHLILVNAVVQAIAGVLGAAVVSAIREHGARILLNAAFGAIGGGVGGFFLHAQIPALVNGGGEPNTDMSPADDLAMRALAGFIAGGLLALIFSLLDVFRDTHINNK